VSLFGAFKALFHPIPSHPSHFVPLKHLFPRQQAAETPCNNAAPDNTTSPKFFMVQTSG
jgi:hypothetical protein